MVEQWVGTGWALGWAMEQWLVPWCAMVTGPAPRPPAIPSGFFWCLVAPDESHGWANVWDRLEEGYENLWIVEQPCEQAKGLSKKWAMGEPCVGNVSSSGSEWFLLVPHWGNG